jgi:tetratricopeptide (TPR) repeat protein
VDGGGNLLESEIIKHELTHALLHEFLVTNPPWVQEGLACYLETLQLDRAKGEAIRGKSNWERQLWLRTERPDDVNWSLKVLGVGAQLFAYDEYVTESFSWGLVHWLVDTEPQKFQAFLDLLAKGETMWSAFNRVFPALTEEKMAAAMDEFFTHQETMHEERFPVAPWAGVVSLRKLPPGEVFGLRAQLFHGTFGAWARYNQDKMAVEAEHSLALDPGNPLALAIAPKGNRQLAIDQHPDDWRSWMLWFDEHDTDLAALRKAAALAPDNPVVLGRLALAESDEGKAPEAIEHAERAFANLPGPSTLEALAIVYDKGGRCADAIAMDERALDSLPNRPEVKWPGILSARLEDITFRCDKSDKSTAGVEPDASAQPADVQPVLKGCRQPLDMEPQQSEPASAQLTIREDGSVTAVAVRGMADTYLNGMARRFVESCRFEPIVVAGKPQKIRVDLMIDSMVK